MDVKEKAAPSPGPQTRQAPEIGAKQYKAASSVETDVGTRSITFIASDESVDRYGDIIRVEGWNLDNFQRNPVLLFAHDSSEPPIGKVTECTVKGKKLIAKCEFMPEGMYDFADKIWTMVKGGFLKAVSVGFIPLVGPNYIRDDKNEYITGFEFIGQELIELSVVPVPANPNALALAKSLGASKEARAKMFSDYALFQKEVDEAVQEELKKQREAEELVQREVSRSHQYDDARVRLARLGVSGSK